MDRLRRSTTDEVAYLARRRQTAVDRMLGWGTEMTGSVLVTSGISALDADAALAARFGLTTGHTNAVDGYVLDTQVAVLVDTHGLVPDGPLIYRWLVWHTADDGERPHTHRGRPQSARSTIVGHAPCQESLHSV